MKGALLLLALLVTRELTFKMWEEEACPIFYGMYGTVGLGNKTLLNTILDLVNATNAEKAVLGKIQDRSNEVGFDPKVSDLKLTASITFSKDCIKYSVSSLVNAIFRNILSVLC
ncbi:major allergen I polypeptide chain 2-like [Moschus berezovskii]|uniref:major allergen I polypeptide chain 2-like n=1 Tax=Moschus berezovskii TaxID=68408 RepID=UPI002443DB93|nr:major allergen I polypeptide chain 2-like [Moschus berezovskii]